MSSKTANKSKKTKPVKEPELVKFMDDAGAREFVRLVAKWHETEDYFPLFRHEIRNMLKTCRIEFNYVPRAKRQEFQGE